MMSNKFSLQHSAKGTSWFKKDAKYIRKEKVNGKVNYIYKEADKAYGEVSKDNPYIMDEWNHDQKIANIWAHDEEWKEIVRNNDPEYVKIDKKTGKKKYLIDDYVAKKKHPALNAIDDLASGRDISLHNITKKSVVGGLNDYAQLGMRYVGTRAKILTTMFKYNSGAYANEQQEVENTISSGSKFVKDLLKAFGY